MQLLLVALNFVLSYNSRYYITNTHTLMGLSPPKIQPYSLFMRISDWANLHFRHLSQKFWGEGINKLTDLFSLMKICCYKD